MKFLTKCRTKNLGMIYSFLGRFCSFLNWEGADILLQIKPRKIPDFLFVRVDALHSSQIFFSHVRIFSRVEPVKSGEHKESS